MQTDVGAEEEISSYLFFARSIYTVQPCDATSVTASLLTTHVVLSTVPPPLNLVLPFENLSLSLSFSLSLSVPSVLLPLQVEMVARICWPSVPFNFSSHRNWGDVRRESRSTSVAVVKDLVRGETVLCRLLLVFFRDYYYR